MVSEKRIPDCYLTYTLQPYPSFDPLQKLLPPNCMVHSKSLIPGLASETMPIPQPRSKLEKPPVLIKPASVYIHNCEVQGSPHTEATLERILAQMYSNKKMSKTGMKQDPSDINVFMEARQINIKVHNSWKQISNTATCSLRPPDSKGTFDSDATITLKDYIPNALCALLFELEFKASIQGYESKSMRLGFALAMPELNSIN